MCPQGGGELNGDRGHRVEGVLTTSGVGPVLGGGNGPRAKLGDTWPEVGSMHRVQTRGVRKEGHKLRLAGEEVGRFPRKGTGREPWHSAAWEGASLSKKNTVESMTYVPFVPPLAPSSPHPPPHPDPHFLFKKKTALALAGMVQLVVCHPGYRGVVGLSSHRGHLSKSILKSFRN